MPLDAWDHKDRKTLPLHPQNTVMGLSLMFFDATQAYKHPKDYLQETRLMDKIIGCSHFIGLRNLKEMDSLQLSETLKDGKNIGPEVQNLFPSPVYLCP